MPRAAIFDVDNTLVAGMSGGMLVRYAFERKILSPLARARTLVNLGRYRWLKLPEERIVELGVLVWSGLREERLRELAAECFEAVVRPKLFAEGVERVRRHRERGETVMLASGSPHFLIEAIARHLGAESAVGTRPRYEGGVSRRAVERPICYREGKLALVEARLAELGIPLSECVAYTDHEIDLPLLERVGERVAVNPSPALREYALREGWRIEEWTTLPRSRAG